MSVKETLERGKYASLFTRKEKKCIDKNMFFYQLSLATKAASDNVCQSCPTGHASVTECRPEGQFTSVRQITRNPNVGGGRLSRVSPSLVGRCPDWSPDIVSSRLLIDGRWRGGGCSAVAN